MTTAEEVAAAMKRVAESYNATVADLNRMMDTAGDSLRRWAEQLNAERLLHSTMRTYSPEERVALERMVRRLREAEPDLPMADVIMRCGAAIEACR